MATKAKPDYPWYQVISGNEITQGDILSNCPILTPAPEEILLRVAQGADEIIEDLPVKRANLIVMTQACDIENKKAASIVFCPIWPLEAFARDAGGAKHLATVKGKEELRKGNLPPFHLLNSDPDFQFDFHVVDFRELYSLPTDVTAMIAEKAGDRLRLLSPYREHLSQSFARYFMWVGLPLDIPAFQ
jgi:hypothetical protein